MSKLRPDNRRCVGILFLAVVLCLVWMQPSGSAFGGPPPPLSCKIKEVRDTSVTFELPCPRAGWEGYDVTVYCGMSDGKQKEQDWEKSKKLAPADEKTRKERASRTVKLEGLECEEDYYYRACAENAEGAEWTGAKILTTRKWIMPGWIVLLIVLALLTLPWMFGNFVARRVRMPDHGWKIGLITWSIACGAVIVSMSFLFGEGPKLGIDLRGGVILIYDMDPEKKKVGEKIPMDEMVQAIINRVDPAGTKQVVVRPYGTDQIEVIVPEADENALRQLKRDIVTMGKLEFRILASSLPNKDEELIDLANQEDGEKVMDGKIELGRWVPVKPGKEANFHDYPNIATRIRWKDDLEVLEILVVKDTWDVGGKYLTDASKGYDQSGGPCVNFRFDSEGGNLFGGLTGENLPDSQDRRRHLGIILDGYLFSAPGIKSTIYDRGEISGNFTQKEVKSLVDVLNGGSLPVELSKEPASEFLSGATLGKDTIKKGKWAISASMVLVLVFMLFYYRFAGVIACMALLTNLLLILAIMIAVNAAFTLPGLAALVLTVGMAVDANVLIFERIREELARGAALRMAIRNGFSRATTTIVDANLTTLITAIILYWIGTDQVRGFAVTLFLGVVLSMYTAIFCSRVVFDIAEKRRWISKLSMLRLLGGTKIDFLGKRRLAGAVSLIVIVIGLAGVVSRNKGLLDIDFTGGISVQLLFKEGQDTADVRKKLAARADDLPDLAVSNVQIEGEDEGLRFRIDTSNQTMSDVEKTVREIFRDEEGSLLESNVITYGALEEIPEAETPPPPKLPEAGDQGRHDLPDDSVLAMADPAPVAPAEADPSVEAPATQPPPEPADSPSGEAEDGSPDAPPAEPPAANESDQSTADGAKEPVEGPLPDPAEGPAKAPAGKDPAALPTTEQSDQPPAEPAVVEADKFAGWMRREITFKLDVDYPALKKMVEDGLKAAGKKPKEKYALPADREGTNASYDTWEVKLDYPRAEAEKVFDAIKTEVESTPHFPETNSIGGKVAEHAQQQAVLALLFSLVAIVGYIWIRFQRVIFGLAAVIALVHDVLVTLGMIAISFWLADFLGFLLIDPFKIGLTTLAAFLTIIGYSLNDTIVVFDRIREVRGKAPRLTAEMVNTSINQTLSRTLLTSATTLIVVLILYAFGGQGVHGFAFALVVGVLVGTYSSIFVASPALYWMSRPSTAAK